MNDPNGTNARQGSVAPPGFASAQPLAPTSQQQPAAGPAYPHAASRHQPVPPQPAPGPVPTQEQPVPGGPLPGPAPASYGALLAQVMLLVAVAVGIFAAASVIGGSLELKTGRNLWIAGVVMLFAQSFVDDLRKGTVGIAWLFALAFTLGLGFGPVLELYLAMNPDVVAEAAMMTAAGVLGTAVYGTFTARDLVSWMRPVSLVLFGSVLLSWLLCFAQAGSPPILSAAIGLLSAGAIVLNFNYLRRHATQDDVIELATGIFVSVLNIFLSLLNLFSD